MFHFPFGLLWLIWAKGLHGLDIPTEGESAAPTASCHTCGPSETPWLLTEGGALLAPAEWGMTWVSDQAFPYLRYHARIQTHGRLSHASKHHYEYGAVCGVDLVGSCFCFVCLTAFMFWRLCFSTPFVSSQHHILCSTVCCVLRLMLASV